MGSKNIRNELTNVGQSRDLTEKWPNEAGNIQNISDAMPSSSESKPREIRQIIPLDMKKLKDLGIESNILSALNKFNAKEKFSVEASVEEATVPAADNSTNSSSDQSTISSKERHSRFAANKVQILSDIRLGNNKIMLANQLLSNAALCANSIVSNDIANKLPMPIESPPTELSRNNDSSNDSVATDESIEFCGFNTSDQLFERHRSHSVNALDGFGSCRPAYSAECTGIVFDELQQTLTTHVDNNVIHNDAGDDSGAMKMIEGKVREPAFVADTKYETNSVELKGLENDDGDENDNDGDDNEDEDDDNDSDLEDLIEQARLTIENECRGEKLSTVCIKPDTASQALDVSESDDSKQFIADFLQSTKNSFLLQHIDESGGSNDDTPDLILEENDEPLEDFPTIGECDQIPATKDKTMEMPQDNNEKSVLGASQTNDNVIHDNDQQTDLITIQQEAKNINPLAASKESKMSSAEPIGGITLLIETYNASVICQSKQCRTFE